MVTNFVSDGVAFENKREGCAAALERVDAAIKRGTMHKPRQQPTSQATLLLPWFVRRTLSSWLRQPVFESSTAVLFRLLFVSACRTDGRELEHYTAGNRLQNGPQHA